MEYRILTQINSPEDLKKLSKEQINELCDEIRAFLLDEVGKSGGHLASNLGVTELTVAIHKVFDSPKDHVIFDVGHQSYVHKLLTGRRERFADLRKPGGLSGFTSMRESAHDAFGAGHSSTSISAALGYAESDALMGNDKFTVCVTGDGAYTGGMIHEAINNCKNDLRLVIILNENGMSISKNKGAFASYLSSVRLSKSYIEAKEGTKSFLNRIPLIGRPISRFMSFVKRCLKTVLFRPNYFEELGFYYLGPIDGNDYEKVEKALEKAKSIGKCVFVHVITTKGKGCKEAELDPAIFHSVSGGSSSNDSYHSVCVDKLIEVAKEDEKVIGVTAAMGIGTGLSKFEEQFPKRYFDVGIAEMHALTFSAGLAANGFKPYAAIYSTFLQRGYDNLVHDIALQSLPVTVLIDRAGLAPSDGATHHGIFDVSFMSQIPNTVIYSPVFYSSLERFLDKSKDINALVAIRYPNKQEDSSLRAYFKDFEYSEALNLVADFDLDNPPKQIFVTYGSIAGRVLEAKQLLSSRGVDAGIVLIEQLKPYNTTVDFLGGIIKAGSHIVYVEEGIKNGGAAMITEQMLQSKGVLKNAGFDIVAIDDNFAIPDKVCDIYDYMGYSKEALANRFIKENE